MTDPTDTVLLIATDDRVRTLMLNRPQSRNALSVALRRRFFGALRDAQADADVDVAIVTGADPVFCAGLDLKELGDTSQLPDISPQWPPMNKPVIGAINGAATTGRNRAPAVPSTIRPDTRPAGCVRIGPTHLPVGIPPARNTESRQCFPARARSSPDDDPHQ